MINIWADTFLHASGAAEKDFRETVHPEEKPNRRRRGFRTRRLINAGARLGAVGVILVAFLA